MSSNALSKVLGVDSFQVVESYILLAVDGA